MHTHNCAYTQKIDTNIHKQAYTQHAWTHACHMYTCAHTHM